ncbi:MAG: TlpA family protein disulfide reductase [Chloroflexi bacterium]|nr:TlpA family protein disulfide reductase [Chloroflexota bacterium]
MTDVLERQNQPAVRRNPLRFLVWAAVAGLLIFLAWGLTIAFQTQPTDGKAPDFTIETYDGQTLTLSELEGQVVVLNFWASWCAPCSVEAPELEAAWQRYKDDGVVFIGIGYVDSKEKAEAFIAEHGLTYPNGDDLGSHISDDYAIRGVPETFVINTEGEVAFFAARPVTFEELVAEIEAARSVEATR